MSCNICKKKCLSKIALDKHIKKPHIEFLHEMDNVEFEIETETESESEIDDPLDSDDMFAGMT